MATKGFGRLIVVLTTIVAAVMELIDTSIVNVALTQMSGSLGVNIEDIAWVITSYAIANVIIIPMTGFLAEYFGRKNYYIVSMVIFTIASYMCASSYNLVGLVFWRFIQGIGGGALLSTSQAILFDAFEIKDRPIAAGIFGMGLILGPTLGPTLGGYLIDHQSWPWIFMINVPIGLLATFLAYTFIDKKPGEGTHKSEITIDYLGIILLAVGVGSLQYVLERGQSQDWFASDLIVITAVTAVVGLSGFIWRQLTTDHPVVNLRVLGNRSLALTTIFTFVVGFGLFTSVFVYPIFVQRISGWTPGMTGLSLLAPTAIGVIMFPIVGRRMAAGASPTPFIVVGFLLFIAFSWISAGMNADANSWNYYIPLLFRAMGISMVQLPLITQAVAGLKPKEYPAGIALNNMIRQLGGSFGIAIANTFIAVKFAQHRSDLLQYVAPGNPQYDARLSNLTQNFLAKTGDATTAALDALKSIDYALEKQANMLAYLDTFRLVAYFFIAVFPLVLLIRNKKQADPASAAKAAAESH